MDVKAYAEKNPAIFLSLCSMPYNQMRCLAEDLERNCGKILFLRFFESASMVRLVMGSSDLPFVLKTVNRAVKNGARARLVTDTTLCFVCSMGCRKSGIAAQLVNICDDNRIEMHHIGVTDTEIMLCISSKDREKFRKALLDKVRFII